ncbi:hypothetical protein BQ8794_20048 [Mesorhizobium prunaredense]|uniref:Uncharacterized protein n=1 Tax=Mesorhizobium prunaredense TaxID=1631249 RepID=A0A1R3V548_9HYPH|nr:hypothetical protein BQ8794_20048 [Mesorhizobium prunaredense]
MKKYRLFFAFSPQGCNLLRLCNILWTERTARGDSDASVNFVAELTALRGESSSQKSWRTRAEDFPRLRCFARALILKLIH